MTARSKAAPGHEKPSPKPEGNDSEPVDLEGVLDKLERTADGADKVSIGDLHDVIGRRSFGPLLLLPGLAALTPIGVIPGAPTALALVLILIAGQLVFGRESFWLPRWLRKLSVGTGKVKRGVRAARPVARFVDRLLKPRLTRLTSGPAVRGVALLVALLALAIPPMELVPFGVFAPAAAVTAIALGLTAHDGLVVVIAFALAAVTGAVGVAALA